MKRILNSSIFLLICFSAFSQPKQPNLYLHQADSLAMIQWSDSVFDAMTFEERVGQLFMPVLEVKNTSQNKALLNKYLDEYKVGGILFSKGDVLTQAELTNEAQAKSKVPLFISLDGEWGLAMRLHDAPRFPHNMMLGAISDDALIEAYGREVGRQCELMGIHINFAPVLDINTNPKNPVINTRSFGENKELVSRKSIAYAKGLESHHVIAVGKHFPGHGDTKDDSHLTLPLLMHDSTRMYEHEMVPFREFIDAGFSGMLTAHLSIPSLDSTKVASSLSKPIVRDILQKKFDFNGLVFTDGLAMKGVTSTPDYCVKALRAGNDILLGPPQVGYHVNRVVEAIEEGVLSLSDIEEKCLKILRYKYLVGLNQVEPIQTKHLLAQLNTINTQILNRKLHANAITILQDDNEILPLQRLDERNMMVVSMGAFPQNAFIHRMNQYNKLPSYVHESGKPLSSLLSKTEDRDFLIVTIQSSKSADVEAVQKLTRGKRFMLVFFTSPYQLTAYKDVIDEAQAVVLAYEPTLLAGQAAAEIIYGGTSAKGRLSVTIPSLFKVKTGIQHDKTRLGYRFPEEEKMDSYILHRIDTLVQRGIKNNAFPGCQILIAKNGNIIFEKSYGFYDYSKTRPVTSQTVYDLASVTKATATLPALMRAHDEYHLKTSQKLSQYIPELKHTDKSRITFRDALFHESGLPASYPFYRMAIQEDSLPTPLFSKVRDQKHRLQADKNLYAYTDYQFRPNLISATPSNDYSLQVAKGMYLNSTFKDSILNKIIHLPLKQVGHYRYSCLNFVLLRQAVENITHQPIDRYLYKKIYAPLGAHSLRYNPSLTDDSLYVAPTENDEFLRKQLLVGYVHDEIAAFSGGVQGNAGLFGNAGDLAKLLQMFLNEGEYGEERYFSQQTTRLFTMTKSSKSRRGLGFDKPDVLNPRLSPTAPQAPGSTYGHTGYTGTAFWVDPDNQLIYIFLTNRVYPHRWNNQLTRDNYRTRIQEIIYKAIK